MSNIFDIINRFIRTNDTPTYGDLMNNNKNEVKNNSIKRLCNTNEYEAYNEMYNFDMKRLQDQHDLKDNYLMGSQKNGQEVNIPGIGTVKQMC